MVRTAFVALLVGAAPALAEAPIIADDMAEWLKTHSPYGVDVYPDGTVWVSAGFDAAGTEYGLLADDLKRFKPPSDYVWLLSNHRNDKTVKYRFTKSRLYFDCKGRTLSRTTWIKYAADNTVAAQGKDSAWSQHDPAPGSMGDRWMRLVRGDP